MATPTTLPASFTAGQVLTAAQMNDLRGAFRVLQVVQATKNNVFSTSSATFVDITDLSVSITPSAATSKILVFSTVVIGQNTGDGFLRLMRDSTAIAAGTSGSGIFNGFGMTATTYNNQFFSSTVTFLDSPATTSATTYKIQGVANTGTLYVNRRGADTTYGGFSSIIVMEISA
jgi:hypothetical protein